MFPARRADVIDKLAAANAEYEELFGHVYLVCATGKSAQELLAICEARLANDPDTERGVVLDELAKINRLRLTKLLHAETDMSLSTHVLDAMTGLPAQGVLVTLKQRVDDRWLHVANGRTDADGECASSGSPGVGVHRIGFDTGVYFAERGVSTFYPEVTITFEVVDAAAHHHVPLLLSPFAFSTYRGS